MSTLFKPCRFFLCMLVSCIASVLLAGCEVVPREDKYVLFREHMPRSILVLPPINESLDVNASYSYVTTVSQPIAEQGYYVFPVAVIDEFMKDNGLPTPADMHGVSLKKIEEIIGADAVLYITLERFGQKFYITSSETQVYARAEMVDVKTGQLLWSNSVRHSDESYSGDQSLLGNLLNAVVTQVVDTVNDKSHDAAIIANQALFKDPSEGLLLGPLHPDFTVETDVDESALPVAVDTVETNEIVE